MKKVFSLKKYVECCKKNNRAPEQIEFSKKIWGSKCNGLTKKEMEEQYGYRCSDNWLEEVPNTQKNSKIEELNDKYIKYLDDKMSITADQEQLRKIFKKLNEVIRYINKEE